MSKVEQRPVIGIVPTQVPDEDIVAYTALMGSWRQSKCAIARS